VLRVCTQLIEVANGFKLVTGVFTQRDLARRSLRKFSVGYFNCIDPEGNSSRRRRRSRSKEFLVKKYSGLFELCVSAVK
jgi:hypothetical protein